MPCFALFSRVNDIICAHSLIDDLLENAFLVKITYKTEVFMSEADTIPALDLSLIDKHSFSRDDLIDCGYGRLFGPGRAHLPIDEMLMIDRITHIDEKGGKKNRGKIIAELDINPDLWFFKCHFVSDPVMPGCLGLDALWQLLGFYLAWKGNWGIGRALGCGKVSFKGQVLPTIEKLTYEIDISRVREGRAVLGIADAVVIADGNIIYTAENLKVGLFTSIEDF
ncbi:MAG: 3-hydroxyacyl-[acyl-carrier protein] dehydratase/trans-2-decenoyl-[acyl-carrier protein] isomerase [Flavobacterium sp.]|jgi:3-hydroxyacyl-[acyl-carrier protein] dehydratase/trans-2-decenoyl-[acyl-carrier protein] isomerase